MTNATPENLRPARYKAWCNRVHAARRAEERYGLTLSADDIGEIEDRVRAGGAGVVPIRPDHQRKSRTIFAVERDGTWLAVAFDLATDSVITFLPPLALDQYRNVLAPKPEAAPAPPPRTPFVPIVTGFVPVADPLSMLPPAPGALGSDATIEDMDEAVVAIEARHEAIVGALRGFPKGHYLRRVLVAEDERIGKARKAIKARRHQLHTLLSEKLAGTRGGPEGALASLLGAFRAVAGRYGWDHLTEEEKASCDHADDLLRDSATLAEQQIIEGLE